MNRTNDHEKKTLAPLGGTVMNLKIGGLSWFRGRRKKLFAYGTRKSVRVYGLSLALSASLGFRRP